MSIHANLYRKLAAEGNADAQVVVDEMGAIPMQEQADTESESDAGGNPDAERAAELAAFAEKVGAMKAKADILAAAGDLKGAADAHMQRGDEYRWRDQALEAMHAYRDAAVAYRQFGADACARLTPEQIRAWHAGEKAGG